MAGRRARPAGVARLLTIVAGLASLAASGASAAPGVHEDHVLFAQSACLTGPNRNLGILYQAGILAAFAEINEQGGVNGRRLEMETLDDGYEAERAAANAERFVADNNMLAVIGAVGTPTSNRIAPVLRTAGIPFVGPLTGAELLRDTQRYDNVVNLRASYYEETDQLVRHMLEQGHRRFGVIYQDDAFGRSVVRNYKALLDRHGIPILARNAYTRNTHSVHTSLFSLEKADLDALLLVGAYAANSTIINLANSLGQDYMLGNLSFVLSFELRRQVEQHSERILVTEVVPDPTDRSLAIVRSFHEAMDSWMAGAASLESDPINEVSLEGYILGRFLAEVLGRIEGKWTRTSLMREALSPEPLALDDWTLEFAPGANTGSRYVRLTHFGE